MQLHFKPDLDYPMAAIEAVRNAPTRESLAFEMFFVRVEHRTAAGEEQEKD